MRRARLLNLGALLVGLGFMAAMCAKLGWAEVAGALRSVGWGFGWLLLIGCGEVALEGTALWIATGRQAPLPRALGATLSGMAVNAFTPLGESGELIKWNLLRAHAGGGEVASGVLAWNALYRLAKFALIFAGPLLLLALGGGAFPARTLWLMEAAALVAFLPTAAYLALLWRGSAEAVVRVAQRLPLLRAASIEARLARARATDARLREFLLAHRRDAALAFALLAMSQLLLALELHVALGMLGAAVDYPTSLFLFGGAMVVGVYLSFFPVQIGVAEAGQYFLFGLVGLSPTLGFAQGLVRRVRLLAFHALGFAHLGAHGFARAPAAEGGAPRRLP